MMSLVIHALRAGSISMNLLAAVDISLGADSGRRRGVAAGAGRGAASYGVKVRNSPIATISPSR
jgi:hypothetical protein